MMTITKGKIPCAKKIVFYGPEGIGKSTAASQFPDPVYIDTEGSTKELDVARFDPPSSWQMLLNQVQYVIDNPQICRTLVLDTADWAEQLMIRHICAQRHWSGLEDPGYGKGYQYAAEEWGGQLLNRLSEVAARGVNVVGTAHAWLRKVELPEEASAYDHWEMKTSKKVAPMLREWADAVFFLHYETIVVKADSKDKKGKAQGGRRVIETTHTPYWDAKNRFGLPEKLPLDHGGIAQILQCLQPVQPVQIAPPADLQTYTQIIEPDANLPFTGPGPAAQLPDPPIPDGIPAPLWDLMIASNVTEAEVRAAVAHAGYFPADMPVKDYPQDFTLGCLVGCWDSVFASIQAARKEK